VTNFYAGIGSRKTPKETLALMTQIASKLRDLGYVLRSGHADGADQAFEAGAAGRAQIFLPWLSFNHHVTTGDANIFAAPSQQAHILAAQIHPNWAACSQAAQKLHARNMHQILGPDLKDPVRFVICWTPIVNGIETGGTAQAIRLARSRNIPVFNLEREKDRERLQRFVAPVNGLAVPA
jgi:hypothetical protein